MPVVILVVRAHPDYAEIHLFVGPSAACVFFIDLRWRSGLQNLLLSGDIYRSPGMK